MEQSIIYIQSITGKPLMPTRRHNKVWYWLRKGLAQVVCREPFTIRLQFETSAYTQPIDVGVDPGSKTVGIAAISPQEVLWQAEVHLRTDISQKLLQRRQYRRNRRARKSRYRPARWANRRRPEGWLSPSIRSKAEATAKAVRWVVRLLPVSQVRVELPSFDTQKMQDPDIEGLEYQQGELTGYKVRAYVFHVWGHQCAYCKACRVPLQVEHIVPRSCGGSNRVSNLTVACEPCNLRKDRQTAAEFGFPDVQAQVRPPLKDVAHVSSLKTGLLAQLVEWFGAERVITTAGYQTAYQRIQVLRWPKSHTNDAVAIACEVSNVIKPLAEVHHLRCIPRGSYQLFNGKRSEHKVSAPKKVRGWKLYEVVEAKGMKGYTGGRRLKGSFVLKDLITGKALLEVTSHKLRRLARPVQGCMIHREEGRAFATD